MASVAIILLNYNSTRLTKKCLSSLAATADPQDTYHIVVWDNASANPPKESEFDGIDLILSKKNLGFAEGNNAAARFAIKKYAPEYVLLLNNDTRMTKGCIRRMIQTFEEHPDSGCVVPKIYFEKGYEFHKNYHKQQIGKVLWFAGGGIDWKNCIPFHKGVDEVDRSHFDTNTSPLPFLRKTELAERMEKTVLEDDGSSLLFLHPHETATSYPTEFATGCCMLISVKIWKKSKGFDPKYFLYYEDTDLSYRIQKLKKTIYFEPRAVLYHLNAGSTSGSGSDIHAYYQTRNRLRFALSYAPLRTKLAVLKEARRMFSTGTKAVRLGILDALGGRWGNQTHRVRTDKA